MDLCWTAHPGDPVLTSLRARLYLPSATVAAVRAEPGREADAHGYGDGSFRRPCRLRSCGCDGGRDFLYSYFKLCFQTIDISALTLALETLTPRIEDLDNQNQRGKWVARTNDVQPVLERILATVEDKPEWYGEVSMMFATAAK